MLTFADFIQKQLDDAQTDKQKVTFWGQNQEAYTIHLLYKYLSYCALFPQTSDNRNEKTGHVLVPVHIVLEQIHIVHQYCTRLQQTAGNFIQPVIEDDKPKASRIDNDTQDLANGFGKVDQAVKNAVRVAIGKYIFESSPLGVATHSETLFLIGVFAFAIIEISMLAADVSAKTGTPVTLVLAPVLGLIGLAIHQYFHEYKAPQRTATAADAFDILPDGNNVLVNASEAIFNVKKITLQTSLQEANAKILRNAEANPSTHIAALVQVNVNNTHFNDIYTNHQAYEEGKGLLEHITTSAVTTEKPVTFTRKRYEGVVDITQLAKTMKNNCNYKAPVLKV